MKKTTLAIVCLLGCTALSLSAQEAEKKQLHEIKVKFDKVPDGLANYYSGYYYYNGKEIYNMRNYPHIDYTETIAHQSCIGCRNHTVTYSFR